MSILLALSSVAFAADGAEISRSKGKREGVVVLWPRVVPETDDPVILDMAARLQERLASSAGEVVDSRLVDRRPQPERVCPQSGCRGHSVGLLLGHREGGCVAVGIVGPPGPEVQLLVPLAGSLQMVDPGLPFRSAPEQKFIVSEFVPCGQLESAFDPGELTETLARMVTAPR